jgi:hypothetical protein
MRLSNFHRQESTPEKLLNNRATNCDKFTMIMLCRLRRGTDLWVKYPTIAQLQKVPASVMQRQVRKDIR